MGLLDRFRPPAGIAVIIDSPTCLPGEEVTATIRMAAKRGMELEEARAELVMENEYETVERRDTGRGTSTVTSKRTDRAIAAEERLIESGQLAGGSESEHVVTFRVPNDAVPSGKGKITEVRWKVRGVLARRTARDAVGETTLAVLSPPELYAARAAGGPEIDADDCALELRLVPGPHVRAGEALSGTLAATPQGPLRLQQVRLELVREEEVPLGVGNEESAVEAAVVVAEETELTARTEYAFELTAPADLCPCLETAESTVRWWLRGVLARRMRGDYTIRQELNVYTGAGDVPAAVAVAEARRDEPLEVFRRPPGAGPEPAA